MIEFRILGPVDLRQGGARGAPVEAVLTQPKRLALLAFLAAATPHGLQRRDTLLALFWPELDAAHARNSLSKALHHLRRALGAEVIVTRGDEEVGISDAAIWCDVHAFESALDSARIADAVALYRGDLLAGFNLSTVAPEFDFWLEAERRRLRTGGAALGWSAAEAAEAAGSEAEAIHWGRWAAALQPNEEAELRRLVALLDRLGDRAGAVRAYDEFRRRFHREYQADPAAKSRELIDTLTARAIPTAAPLARAVATPLPESTARPGIAQARPAWRVALLGVAGLLALISVTTFGPRKRVEPPAATPDRVATIAVLPFVDLSPAQDNQYFADGITDELIDALGRIGGLRITARSSAFAFRGNTGDARAIGKALGVATLLEASIRRAGTRLRVTATLIDATTGYNVWSQTYDRELVDVFAVQDELTRAIAGELQTRFAAVRAVPERRVHSPDLRTYSLYLEGRYFSNRRTKEALEQAIVDFQRALAADSAYAPAYLGLAEAYDFLAAQGYADPDSVFQRAKAATLRAIALDSTLPDAHRALEFLLLFHEWNGAAAGRELERALALDPSNASARLHHTFYLIAVGRTMEAVEEARHAVALDPLSLIINARLGFALTMARRYDEAIAAERHTLQLDSTFAPALWTLGDALTLERRFGEAIPQFRKAIAHSRLMLGDLGFSYGAAGDRPSAERYLGELAARARSAYVDPYERAIVYAGLRDRNNAFHWLELAVEAHSPQLIWLRSEPMLDALRPDPRFAALLQHIGL